MAINRSTKPEDVIETTQSLRLQMISELTGEGLTIPEDPKMLATLNQTLRDLDTAALTTQKLTVEEKQVDAASRVASNLANIYKQLGGKNPFERDMGAAKRVDEAERLPVIDKVPGHTRQGVEELNYEDFVGRER